MIVRARSREDLEEFWALRKLASPRLAGVEQDVLELGDRVALEFAWAHLFEEARR